MNYIYSKVNKRISKSSIIQAPLNQVRSLRHHHLYFTIISSSGKILKKFHDCFQEPKREKFTLVIIQSYPLSNEKRKLVIKEIDNQVIVVQSQTKVIKVIRRANKVIERDCYQTGEVSLRIYGQFTFWYLIIYVSVLIILCRSH